MAAYRALLADGTPSSEVAFVGESAGGGLVVATLVALKEAVPQPSSAVVFSLGRSDPVRGQPDRQGGRRSALTAKGCRSAPATTWARPTPPRPWPARSSPT
ncbi:hypothetical protein O1M63_27990 [Streptomyces mirabilis]|nr:hypothetical protein [Streptomyces mirabilis]